MGQDYIYEGMKLYNHQGRAMIVYSIQWRNGLKDDAIIYGKFEYDSNIKKFATSTFGKYLFYELNEIKWKDKVGILRTQYKYAVFSEEVKKALEVEKEEKRKRLVQKKINENELNNLHNYLEKEYGFEGFTHTTDFSNFSNIMKDGFIYSRANIQKNGLLLIDSAKRDIIEHTRKDVLNSVRFYFRPKTPTHYNTEGIRPNDSEHHMPIPVLLMLGRDIYSDFKGRICDGNARKRSTIITDDISAAWAFNFDRIFSKGPYYAESLFEHDEITRQRNAELLIPNKVSIDYIDKIIFRSNADLKMARILFGHDPRFILDSSNFNNDYLYSKDYNIKVLEKGIRCEFVFSRGNFDYIRSFSHRILIDFYWLTIEYDLFEIGGVMDYKEGVYSVTLMLPKENYEDVREVKYFIDDHVSAIWRSNND